MWGEQRVWPHRAIITFQAYLDQQYVPLLIGCDPEFQVEAWMMMGDFDGRHTGRGCTYLASTKPFDFHPETLVIGNNESEVAYLRYIDARVIDFVEYAIADGVPDA